MGDESTPCRVVMGNEAWGVESWNASRDPCRPTSDSDIRYQFSFEPCPFTVEKNVYYILKIIYNKIYINIISNQFCFALLTLRFGWVSCVHEKTDI